MNFISITSSSYGSLWTSKAFQLTKWSCWVSSHFDTHVQVLDAHPDRHLNVRRLERLNSADLNGLSLVYTIDYIYANLRRRLTLKQSLAFKLGEHSAFRCSLIHRLIKRLETVHWRVLNSLFKAYHSMKSCLHHSGERERERERESLKN